MKIRTSKIIHEENTISLASPQLWRVTTEGDIEGRTNEMNEVFVVVGSTGEYDDQRSWNVQAFASREHAQRLCNFLNLTLGNYGCDYGSEDLSNRDECLKILTFLDSLASISYTGSRYYVISIPFKDE